MRDRGKLPLSVVLLPSVLATIISGLSIGMIAFGVVATTGGEPLIVFVWTGVGALLGFLWGSLVWSDKIASLYTQHPQDSKRVFDQQVKLEVRSGDDNYPQVDWVDLPVPLETLRKFAGQVLSYGGNLSHSMAGKGEVISRKDFELLRNKLIARNLAEWVNPDSHTQGCRLTRPGHRLFSQLHHPSEYPSPGLLRYLASDTHKHTGDTP